MKTTPTPKPKARTKSYASVRDLVRATASDEGQVREFDRRLEDKIIVNSLIRTRAAAGMSQADVAKKMKCSQSAVSKLEHAMDAELTLQEIASYLKATGGRLHLCIGKQPDRAERIKELVTCLEDELKALTSLGQRAMTPV